MKGCADESRLCRAMHGGAAESGVEEGHGPCCGGRVLLRMLLVLGIALASASPAAAQEASMPTAGPTSRAVDASAPLFWPASPPEGALTHPVLLRGHDMGLISTGIALLSVGSIVAVIIASLDLTIGNCHEFTFFPTTRMIEHEECGTAPLALVPIAGSVLVGNVGFHGSTDIGTILPGSLALAPSIVGLIFLLVGVHGFTEDLVSGDGDLAFRIDPMLSSSAAGASLTVRL